MRRASPWLLPLPLTFVRENRITSDYPESLVNVYNLHKCMPSRNCRALLNSIKYHWGMLRE